jgi:DNA-binding NarL/FixJ family response regulator
MTCIRLLLVDDHSVMRAGLANMLNANPDFKVVAEAEDFDSALDAFQSNRPDVTLMDVSMPGASGLKCLESLRAISPDCCVLMLSSSESEFDIARAIELGARGYVVKSARPAELLDAIRQAFEGQLVLSSEMLQRLKSHRGTTHLTAREIEVLQLLRKGFSNPQIGADLGISARTAKAHVASILEKLGALDRTQAVAIAFERGLLRP